MYLITPTKNIDKIKEIVTNPILWELNTGSADNKDSYQVDTNLIYLLINRKESLVGVLSYKEFTKITIEAHIQILPKYWGTGISLEAIKATIEWIKNNTRYTKILTSTPEDCIHVLKFAKKLNFTTCGSINNGVIYNNKQQALLLLEYDIRGL